MHSLRDNKFAVIFEILLIWFLWKKWTNLEKNFQLKATPTLKSHNDYTIVPVNDESSEFVL